MGTREKVGKAVLIETVRAVVDEIKKPEVRVKIGLAVSRILKVMM